MAAIKPSSLKVVELRQELSDRGLPTKGKKDELVARLTEALAAESDANEEKEESTQEQQQAVVEESQPAPLPTEAAQTTAEEVVTESAEKQEEKEEKILDKQATTEKQADSQTKEEKPVETLTAATTAAAAEVVVVETEKQTEIVNVNESSSKTSVEESVKVSTDQFVVESDDAVNDQHVDEKATGDQTMEEVANSSVHDHSKKEEKKESAHTEEEEEEAVIPTVDYSETEETKDEVVMSEAEPTSADNDKNLKRKASSIAEDKTEKKPRVEENDNEVNSSAIYVKGFVRPLIIRQVQELFSQYGVINRFWMDNIKTHCYIMYEKDSEAKKAFDNVNGIVFPPDTGKKLSVGGLTPEQAEQLISFEQSAATSRSRVDWEANIEKVKAGEELASTASTDERRRSRTMGIGQIAKQLAQAAGASSSSVTASRTPTPTTAQAQEQEQNESNLSLDDLFKKTKTLPILYYLPVSEEIAKARLAKLSK